MSDLMPKKMCVVWTLLLSSLVILTVLGLVWLARWPDNGPKGNSTGGAATRPAGQPVRIGLIPERDIFRLRKRYEALAGYLSAKLGRPVELSTTNTYEGMLKDFDEKHIDLAFAGSLVGALAIDRLDTKVLVKPELPGGISTYHGVIFVRADSAVTSVEQLKGKKVAMLRTTTAGNLYPSCMMATMRALGKPDGFQPLWVGTHDDAVQEVIAGRCDAGAVKNLRLDALLAQNPHWKLRRLAEGREVPNNALLVRADLAETLGPRVTEILLAMDADPAGKKALKGFGALRFIPCTHKQYRAIYVMTEHIGDDWDKIGIEGPALRSPSWFVLDPNETCCDANS